MTQPEKKFADYKLEGKLWVTLASGEYYPDILPRACELYEPVLRLFGQMVTSAPSSIDLFTEIAALTQPWMRVQLARVFRKYVSPDTPVEMLKRKRDAAEICATWGDRFRAITEVQRRFSERPMPDEALCAVLWEYKDRGKKGYDLTEQLFSVLRLKFPELTIIGPERAGRDVLMGEVFPDFPSPKRPVDFVLSEGARVLAVGLARYDSDRGGAQEDDRVGQYRDCAYEVITHSNKLKLNTKVIFLNDGPGLLLGSMWNDYAAIEDAYPGRVKVVTLRMIPERVTLEWLRS